MKKFLTIAIVLLSLNCLAQTPNWVVNENNFQYSMSLVGFVTVNGQQLNNSSDMVAAFVNGECRGVTALIYVANENSYYAYLNIFANTDNETVSFKIYDSIANETTTVSETMTFNINAHNGNLFQAFSIAHPKLNDVSEIASFEFKDIENQGATIDNQSIELVMFEDEELSALIPVFELSVGASLFLNGVLQTSGQNSVDLNSPITYQVRSEDQSNIKEWTVSILKIPRVQAAFYKKGVACHANGAIKVTCNVENLNVVLKQDSEILMEKNITGGEVIFEDLSAGTYSIEIDNISKEITII